jgi:hypothetical protein
LSRHRESYLDGVFPRFYPLGDHFSPSKSMATHICDMCMSTCMYVCMYVYIYVHV